MDTAEVPLSTLPAPSGAGLGCLGLRISVVAAVGQGRTLLSSFDAALHRCGVCDYNLLPLSSVIPPGSEVVSEERHASSPVEFGHRLYVVKAEARSALPGAAVAAGVGWYQWGDGRGVFVEHEATAERLPRDEALPGRGPRDRAEAEVRALILGSLRDLCAVRGIPFAEARVGQRVAAAEVGPVPTTVLVVAVYRAAGWAGDCRGRS